MSEQTKKPNIPKNVQKIIEKARDPEASSTYTFIINGKELPFNRAKSCSDEELANAIVVDRFGYYIRRGLQDVSKKHEFRHSSSQDWVKEEYKVTIQYVDEEDCIEESEQKTNSILKGLISLFKK